ncbi:aminotransferase [Altererythrobacter sp. B11]|uniref:cysteine desulfurase family protein n=1 Tax=Altererythrobacter sp. B11 TaxID=2060312 RepID=UPI000DC6F900|nr:aminotransferase class V-fold PLP-dependent enzyme [Altererythrobacter sp. B11]BBC73745.1 aminotransferase [Altererythrobacter sp. B11]
MTRIYLDYAATTPLLPAAHAALEEGWALWANPSSPHAEGRRARAALEQARARVKAALDWEGEVIFTSGASEALALALRHSRRPLAHVSVVEHEAVLRHAGQAQRWGVEPGSGRITPAPEAPDALFALQHVNNETGVIQPVAEIAAELRAAGGALLCDCAQSAGKIALPPAAMITISAHKFGGPIGVGALLLRDFALLHAGGGQERGYRGGTENLPGAMAMAAALEAGNGWMEEAARLRTVLERGICDAGGEVVAGEAPRIATIGAYRMPGVSAAAQLIRLDGAGFAVSAGSACSSGSLKPSHVLEAMGYPHPGEVIRVSVGRETTEDEIAAFLRQWQAIAGGRAAA